MQSQSELETDGRDAALPLVAPAKIRPPALRPRIVVRPQLLARLDAAVHAPVTLVAAPAGFGKTTLLAAWLAEAQRATRNAQNEQASALAFEQFVWLSLDAGDNDPMRLLHGLIAALQAVAPQLGRAALAAAGAHRRLEPQALLLSLLCDMEALAPPLVLVLDDLHLVTEPHATALLAALAEQQPPTLRLVLASRADPPLPLPRLRARGQLCELRAADLRMDAGEAAAFFQTTLGLALDAGVVSQLVQRTEGWAAGLQLAGLAIQGQGATSALSGLAGAHRLMVDYLADEVLDSQPPAFQQFLLHTSILDRMTGPLCDALLATDPIADCRLQMADGRTGHVNALNVAPTCGTADPSWSEGGAAQRGAQPAALVLEQLERANLFLIPLDGEGRWFRYHHLFADLLRFRLQQRHPERVASLHQRAARWFAGQGLTDEAVQHALAAGDTDLAAGLIAAEGRAWLTRGELATLGRWLDAMPAAAFAAHPRLTLLRAWILVWAYQPASVAALLAPLAAAPPPELAAELLALRAFVARSRDAWDEATRLSEQALAVAPDDPLLQGFLHAGLGDMAWFREQPQQALVSHRCALECAARGGDLVQLIDAVHTLVQYELLQGRLRAAEAVCAHGAGLVATLSPSGPFGALIALSEATISYERFDLATARAAVEQSLSQIERCGLSAYLPFAQIELARIAAAQGDGATTRRVFLAAQQGVQRMVAHSGGHTPIWLAIVQLREVELWLSLGDDAAAVRWAGAHWTLPDERAPVPLLLRQYVLAQLLVAGGTRPALLAPLAARSAVALPALATQLIAACRRRFVTWGLDALVLDLDTLAAVHELQRGDAEAAHRALGAALALAAPEGFVRPFASRGAPMRGLLAAWLRAAPSAEGAFAERLLAALPPVPPAAPVRSDAPQRLVEPLSSRERELLPLLAAGLSHREIAAALTIAPDTARTHIKNIYGKLQVQNRVQAVARARELALV